MNFLIFPLICFLFVVLLCIGRTIALSRHASKLTSGMVWKFNVLSKIGWVLGGAALLTFLVLNAVFTAPELIVLVLCWIGGGVVIWTVPEKICKGL